MILLQHIPWKIYFVLSSILGLLYVNKYSVVVSSFCHTLSLSFYISLTLSLPFCLFVPFCPLFHFVSSIFLQHTATHCNTLQHTATNSSILRTALYNSGKQTYMNMSHTLFHSAHSSIKICFTLKNGSHIPHLFCTQLAILWNPECLVLSNEIFKSEPFMRSIPQNYKGTFIWSM